MVDLAVVDAAVADLAVEEFADTANREHVVTDAAVAERPVADGANRERAVANPAVAKAAVAERAADDTAVADRLMADAADVLEDCAVAEHATPCIKTRRRRYVSVRIQDDDSSPRTCTDRYRPRIHRMTW